MAIFNDYAFGRLVNGAIEYFVPVSGCLKATTERRGKKVNVLISNPTEAQMNAAGWFRVVNVEDNGEDTQVDNIIYHYTGVADVEEPTESTEESDTQEPNE